ncbi:retrovirus-related Pol polyprotein from transposon 17.6 [Trichonephila clavata]|uniref:RNA-directed DNA polymerase n=1 Tax=Trichonephila clavata TaxID=2740835 RepID=A0A8X6GJW8_TRICU|nr:retrovirus-related Pol polyprotein from transposon 17.6 [Trichonephila clavata]
MAFLIRSRKIDLIQLARDLDESPDPSMSKIVLRDLITSSKYYKEEEAKELLEVITAERLETEQQQKLEQQEQLSIEKLRLEVELSKNVNQSATQNNGQASRVKSLDEIVKMVRLLTVKARRDIEDKLSKLVKTSISVDGKLVHALVDSGTEITVIKKELVPGISVEGASTIYLKGIFGPAVKCPLVYVPIGLATGGQVNVVHQQVLCALAEVLVEDVLLPPDVLDMLGGVWSEENSLAQSSQDLREDSGNLDETEVSPRILLEKTQENVEDSQGNITSCQNEVGTIGTKDEEVIAEMDKGSMVADSFRSEQECCAELVLAWKHAKEGKGNYYEVGGGDGYLFHRDKILGESIGQLVIPKCRRTEVLRLTHTSVFSSHMGPKKTLERIKYSFFWEGLRAHVKKFCESCKECQLTRSVMVNDGSPITPVARPELPFQVVNMDQIGPIDPPSTKGHKYILCLVDQHTRWGEAMPLTCLNVKKRKYLGHTIGGGEHGPDEDKVLAIKRLIRPTTKKEVRSVLGLMGFYRAYIPNYAQISTPLTELTKKNKPNEVSWGEAEQSSFDKLKELLCKVTSLATPDANLPFQVHCDASDYDVGCCLTQQDTDGVNMPIAFASQKFTAKQKNWASISRKRPGQCYMG